MLDLKNLFESPWVGNRRTGQYNKRPQGLFVLRRLHYTKNTMTIVPAILETRLETIMRKIDQVASRASLTQIDICDGEFVPSRTYGSSARPDSVANMVVYAHKKKMQVELDMMVNLDRPRKMTRWVEILGIVKPERVVLHLGSTYRWDELFQRMSTYNKKEQLPFECGLAIKIGHTRQEIRKVLSEHSQFSYIQIMGIKKVGYSGQKLSPDIYTYIKKIHRAFPDYPIQIDGGVKEQHIEKLYTAGADRLGMNSGLFKSKNFEGILIGD